MAYVKKPKLSSKIVLDMSLYNDRAKAGRKVRPHKKSEEVEDGIASTMGMFDITQAEKTVRESINNLLKQKNG